jgi:exosome complex RNA-binding protein Rrp42 (RNase PH superfamily)
VPNTGTQMVAAIFAETGVAYPLLLYEGFIATRVELMPGAIIGLETTPMAGK